MYYLKSTINNCRQLKKKKEFTSGAVFKPLQAEVMGQMTLGDYQGVVSRDRQVEELRLVGLTDDEIQLKLSQDNDSANATVGDDDKVCSVCCFFSSMFWFSWHYNGRQCCFV